MREAVLRSHRQAGLARLYGASALACLLACAFPAVPALAQDVSGLAPKAPSGSQMLLAADTLVYDNDKQTVTAVAVPLDHPLAAAFVTKFMTEAIANGTLRKAYDNNGLKDTPVRTEVK